MEVALVVNNLGGTSNLELSIMANGAIRYLGEPLHFHDVIVLDGLSALCSHLIVVDKMQVKVTRVYMGSLMTSLEMAGISLTLLKLKQKWDEYLGKQCWMYMDWPCRRFSMALRLEREKNIASPCFVFYSGSGNETRRPCAYHKDSCNSKYFILAIKRNLGYKIIYQIA